MSTDEYAKNSSGAKTEQEQSNKKVKRFIVIRPTALVEPPHPTVGIPRNLPPDSKGFVVYETEDFDWLNAHILDGGFKEVVSNGQTMTMSVKKGQVRGDDTLFILHYWNDGVCYDVTITQNEIFSQNKVRPAIFAACGNCFDAMEKEDWVTICKEMYRDAVNRGDVGLNEFYASPIYVDFFNFIEQAIPVLNSEDVVAESNDSVWYDEATNEIRPQYNQIKPLLDKFTGTTIKDLVGILADVRVGNTKQESIGKGGSKKKVSVWRIIPDRFVEFMNRVRIEQQKRAVGGKL